MADSLQPRTPRFQRFFAENQVRGPILQEAPMGEVIHINEARIEDHLGEMVRGTVEETLNTMLDAEADQPCDHYQTSVGVD